MFNYLEKYPLLLSYHRSGSTWVQSYIRQSYLMNWPKSLAFSNDFDDEFLSDENFDTDTNYKINFLESLRKRKFELCHKLHADMLYNKHDLNWFADFYKGHDIIILKRRNLWKSLLSYLFHRTVQKKVNVRYDLNKINLRPMHGVKKNSDIIPKQNDILKSTIQSYNIKFKFDVNMCNYYLEQVRYLNTVIEHRLKHLKPEIFIKEDLTTEFLQTRFTLPNYISPIIPLNIKYHLYFKPEELEKMKQFFEYQYENEFKFYGYKYTY